VAKRDFLGLVANVWDDCFKPDLIKGAFEKCGIYPFNREKYPTSEFAPNFLTLYQKERHRLQQVAN